MVSAQVLVMVGKAWVHLFETFHGCTYHLKHWQICVYIPQRREIVIFYYNPRIKAEARETATM